MKMTKISDDVLEMVSGGTGVTSGDDSVNDNNLGESKPAESFCPQCNAQVTFDVYSGGRAYCRPHHHFKQM